MTNDTAKAKGPAQEQKKKEQWQYHKWQHHGQSDAGKKKDPETIPVLKYEPSNNFTMFKEAPANAALKEYGANGKLIKQGDDYLELMELDLKTYDLKSNEYEIIKARYIEDLKDYQK